MRFSRTIIYLSLSLAWSSAMSAEQNTESDPTVDLPKMGVSTDWLGSSEKSGDYTRPQMNTATRLGLSIRETPQSISVISRQVIDDFKLETVTDVVNTATGGSSRALDSSRGSFSARGFDITNLQIDGVPTAWEGGYSAGETMTELKLFVVQQV